MLVCRGGGTSKNKTRARRRSNETLRARFPTELKYDNPTNGVVGYAVYIGPGQYFVITDIGKGNYQWYAFLAREPGSAEVEEKPEGSVKYLKDIFEGWSKDVHAILDATKEEEVSESEVGGAKKRRSNEGLEKASPVSLSLANSLISSVGETDRAARPLRPPPLCGKEVD